LIAQSALQESQRNEAACHQELEAIMDAVPAMILVS
jgi:hypothetical protein